MQPVRVDELLVDMGTAGGHRLTLLSLEVYDEVADLRFARAETPGAPPLSRRVPHQRDVTIEVNGIPARVIDLVGRGDRAFSNGEIRVAPAPPPGATITVTVGLSRADDPLTATLHLPARPMTDPAS